MSLTFVTAKSRTRSLSLSLVATRSPIPLILSLPIELLLAIVTLSIRSSKSTAFSLARVSKLLSTVVSAILCRTVVLPSPRSIYLFHRTITSKPCAFRNFHVKTLIVTCNPASLAPQTRAALSDVIDSCTSLYSLGLPECAILAAPARSAPSELILQSFSGAEINTNSVSIGSAPTSSFPPSITHLRICEPGDIWAAPAKILSCLGPFPHLSHLHLARRAHANEDNDIEFIRDVRRILGESKVLKVLIVSVFTQAWQGGADNSEIWGMLKTVQEEEEEGRVVLREGIWGEWAGEWNWDAIGERVDGFWRNTVLEAKLGLQSHE